jgi:predicted MPP superfamily phosphohydrolase
MVLSVVGGVQVPGVAAVAHLIGSWPLAVGGATLLSLPYLYGLRSPFEDRPKSRLYLGALWPFFTWWVSCLVFAALAPLALVVAWAARLPIDPPLVGALALSIGAGVLAAAREPRLVEREVIVPGLPPALDGYRVAQLSDVHCGSYTPPARIARWVERLNAQKPDLVAVTGDLITSGDWHVEAVARVLGGLRGRDGVYACMGNHDYFDTGSAHPPRQSLVGGGSLRSAPGESLIHALQREGITMLRNEGRVVRDELYVAGTDDTWTRRDDVARALAGKPEGAFALLLAHDPNLFTEAVEHGVGLQLSGHTHGGQLAVPGLHRRLNLARLITPFSGGLYRIGESVLYVSLGAGTTGPPVRLGARAEITLLTLRAIQKEP